jgi:group II intron reverse transcriptase/maturase
LQFYPVSWVVEADIKGFFDHINHEWILKMLEERIHDRAFVHLIGKRLKAGVLEDLHTVIHPASGTPQGGVISPVLANIYLHHVLDIWFERKGKKHCEGTAFFIRYADDFVCAFRYKEDAMRFYAEQLPERLAKFSPALSEEKTRMIKFSRFEPEQRERFDFLGFEYRWEPNSKGEAQVKRRTSRKRLLRAKSEITEWIRKARSLGLRAIMGTLKRKLRGHYNYYGVYHNLESLWQYWHHAMRVVFKWLNRRSRRRSFNWKRFNAILKRYEGPYPYQTEAKRIQTGGC